MGVDPIGMARALFADLRARGITQGGSTIDQQIVKSRFLSQERTWKRKFIEIVLAVLLDARMSKDEILEVYLNDVYLGHNSGKPVLGIDEASRLYLDKLPTELRLDEAAMLASIIRAPNRDNPWKRPDLVRSRRDAILVVMQKHGWITDDQYRSSIAHDVRFVQGSIPQAAFPFYLRALRGEMVREIGIRPVIEGGLTIVCEMDPAAQAAAERVARRGAAQLEARFPWIGAEARSEPLEAAILSVDPRSGGVRALVGGTNYDLSPFDRTSSMRRQPGSAFKTFAYLAAIVSKRATTATLLLDSPVSIAVNGDETWQPHNYDERYRGRVTLREAFEIVMRIRLDNHAAQLEAGTQLLIPGAEHQQLVPPAGVPQARLEPRRGLRATPSQIPRAGGHALDPAAGGEPLERHEDGGRNDERPGRPEEKEQSHRGRTDGARTAPAHCARETAAFRDRGRTHAAVGLQF